MLLSLPQHTLIELKGELKYVEGIPKLSLQECRDYAKSNRPEIKALYLYQETAEKSLELANRANFSNLIFMANYDYKKPLYFKNEWGKAGNLTLVLQLPIFTGFKSIGKIKEASYRVSQSSHELKLLESVVEREVWSAMLQLDESEKLLKSPRENVTQASEVLRIIGER